MSIASAAASSGGDAASAAGEVAPHHPPPPPPLPDPVDLTDPSPSSLTRAVPFSSGNPRIEETHGVMDLYPEDAASPSHLPVGRKPLVCVLAVPNHMTYADFCRFCGSFVQHMLEMRIVRNDGVEDQYSVLIKFDDQSSTDGFYKHFNGKRFTSLEGDICGVCYVVDVQYTGSIEHAQCSISSSAEQPTCPVCLERLEQDTGGILTTICNHSFHCSCISEWTDSSCPAKHEILTSYKVLTKYKFSPFLVQVCRYCQQQPEKSTCSVCGTSENLWICVICGFVGCGRYVEGHAIRHWRETQHCYSLELETQRVWDYVGDNYVHRLIQSKTDGNLVELNSHCFQCDDVFGTCTCSVDSGISDALFNSKVEAILAEYNNLLTSQLENQRKYFESLLLEVKEENEKEISEAVEKATSIKLQKLQIKLAKCMEEKKFLDDINENLLNNEEMWKANIQQIEEREQAAVRLREEKIRNLEEQLRDLIARIEGQNAADQLPDSVSSEVDGGAVLPSPSTAAASSSSSNKSSKRAGGRKEPEK